ncbi:MAG: ATPase, T2SS/T4P/T4SS family [Acutalibacteraceae bacterium]|nr:ATPase, T2SS/T4P/T4SS family [Acutalibacteraceae bacterium]
MAIEKRWELKPDDYGPLWDFVSDDNVTDIDLNCNGEELWVTDLDRGRYRVEPLPIKNEGEKNEVKCDAAFVSTFCQRVANSVSKQFNKKEPLLEAETGNLRISCLFNTAAVSGISISIRKSLPFTRIDPVTAIETGYVTREMLNLLVNCSKARLNFVACGEPGSGKTECIKFLSQFIKASERVITIEDNLELHYRAINPGKDCVELQVDNDFSYETAISACLRQNPKRIFLSEARSREVRYLLECWSTGIRGFTTIHADDVRKIPARIENMMGDDGDKDRLADYIFNFVDVGIMIKKKELEDKSVVRWIDQVCFYICGDQKNEIVMMYDEGKPVEDAKIPEDILKKFKFADITNPFDCGEDF